jgi:HD-GYP domain-containing protein (c-di-GMP phosphodiesterase class II)
MDKIKVFLINHLEKILILGLTIIILITNYFITQKMAFLNFYYLPVLVSGYFLGKKYAVYTSLFSIGLVVFLGVLYPHSFYNQSTGLQLALNLVIWGGFLFLSAAVVGTLYEQKENKIQELKKAYVGVIEILTKYLESSDRYTKGHSIRVADYSTEIAKAMELPKPEIENIRVASLLHDIGKIEISSDLITKAASLTAVTDRPYRAGKPLWQAVEELEKGAGTQFDPEVVEAFKKVLADKVEVA